MQLLIWKYKWQLYYRNSFTLQSSTRLSRTRNLSHFQWECGWVDFCQCQHHRMDGHIKVVGLTTVFITWYHYTIHTVKSFLTSLSINACVSGLNCSLSFTCTIPSWKKNQMNTNRTQIHFTLKRQMLSWDENLYAQDIW